MQFKTTIGLCLWIPWWTNRERRHPLIDPDCFDGVISKCFIEMLKWAFTFKFCYSLWFSCRLDDVCLLSSRRKLCWISIASFMKAKISPDLCTFQRNRYPLANGLIIKNMHLVINIRKLPFVFKRAWHFVFSQTTLWYIV